MAVNHFRVECYYGLVTSTEEDCRPFAHVHSRLQRRSSLLPTTWKAGLRSVSWASSRPRKLVWRVRRCGLQGAQFVDGHQLLGVRLDHRGDADGGFGQGQLQLALPGGRVGDAGLLEPAS